MIEILSEATPEDIKAQQDLNVELEKTKELMADLNEDEDSEPSDAELKKADSVSKLASKDYNKLLNEMKSVVKKWKEAEGAEKEEKLTKTSLKRIN